MIALQPGPSLVSCNAQGNSVFGAQSLEFGHHAAGDDGEAFGVEGVHHGFKQGQLALDGVGEEIGVYQDGVGWNEGGVVLEE